MPVLRKSRPFFMPQVAPVWRPAVDVYQTRDGWLLKFDLAGVGVQDVVVSAGGHRVTLSGIRKDTVIEEGSTYYAMEISYSRFERTIELPVSVDRMRVAMEAQNGLLLVRMVKEGNSNVR